MFRIYAPTSRSLVLASLTVAALLFGGASAHAQPRPPGGSKFWPDGVAAPARPAPTPPPVAHRPAPTPQLSVTVQVPALDESVYVTLRGPDGELRKYRVEGGRNSIQPQTVTVRAGETVTITPQVAVDRK